MLAAPRIRARVASRGMTLLEVLVSVAILAMMSILIYGVFDSMSRGMKGEALRADRAHEGREAVGRLMREFQAAFLSLHSPTNTSLMTRTTVFVGEPSGSFDRVDFAAFAHKRYERDAKESDQCELGYFVAKDSDTTDREKYDLVRREQTPIDLEPRKGGVINALAEDVESFHLRYFDAMTGLWTQRWDTTQISGQPGRLPFEVEVSLSLKGVPGGDPYVFTSKVQIPIQQPLSFGIPKQ